MDRTRAIGLFLIAYGLIHLFGFLTSWELIDVPGLSQTPTVFADDPPLAVLRDFGILWWFGLIAFVLAGYAALTDRHWWEGLTFVSAIVSFIVTIFWIHEAWPGTIANAVIITLIARDWWSHQDTSQSA